MSKVAITEQYLEDIADAIYEIYYGDKTVSGYDVKMDVGYI